MSIETLKADARRLAEHLRTKYGWSLKNAGALEALAICHGYKDWNTYAAAYAASITPAAQPSPASAALTASADEFQNLTLDQVVAAALANEARDILLSATNGVLDVSLRSEGSLARYARLTPAAATALLDALETGQATLTKNRGNVKAGQRALDLGSRQVTLAWQQVNGMCTVIRVLTPDEKPRPPSSVSDWDEQVLKAKDGLFVISGVTGSGKTTVSLQIAALALARNLKVGYLYPVQSIEALPGDRVLKLPFHDEASLDLALQVAQRSGLDLLLVAETSAGIVRSIAEAARNLTILTTMHASGVRSTVLRLAERTAPFPETVFTALRGVRYQRLFWKACEHCQQAGCDQCAQRGYRGVMPLSEDVLFENAEQAESAARGMSWWAPLKSRAEMLARDGVVSRESYESAFGKLDSLA